MRDFDTTNTKVPLNESYDYLQKSLNNLNIQQSTTSNAPDLYPNVNKPQNSINSSQNNINSQSNSNIKY